MKRLLLIITLLTLACSGIASTAEALQPTASQSAATLTPEPGATTTSTPTQPPTATPLPPAISAQNAAQVDKLAEINSASLRRVVFSPNGTVFATGAGNESDYGIKTWQSQGGVLLQSLTGFSGIVWDLAFSPDGQWIASAADDQNGYHVRIWNAADGRQLIALDGPQPASSLAFSPDGARLAVGGLSGWSQGVIWIYDTLTWNRVQLLTAPGQNVTALVFSQDGSRLISSGTDGHIRVWSTPSGTLLKELSAGAQANRLALSPDGSWLASSFCTTTNTNGCTQGGINVWRTADWVVIQKFEDLAESLAFSSDGTLLLSGSGQNDPLVRIRRVEDWGLARTLSGPAFSVALSPDSRLLVSTTYDRIFLWGLR